MDILGEMLVWVLTQLISNSGVSKDELTMDNTYVTTQGFQAVWEYFILIGIGLTIVYFLIEINKRWALEGANMTFKNMFAPFLKLIIACVVMMLSAQFYGWLLSFNNFIAEWADALTFTTALGGTDEQIRDAINNMDFWAKIIMILPALIMFLVSILCNLVWIYKALLYKFELLIRVMFAPIAMSDVYSGNNTTATRYVKGTLALILYGMCLIIIPRMVNGFVIDGFLQELKDLFTAGGWEIFDVIFAFVKMAVAPIAAIGLTSAVRQITKDAVG